MTEIFAFFIKSPWAKEVICINSFNGVCRNLPRKGGSHLLIVLNINTYILSASKPTTIPNLYDLNDAIAIKTGIPKKYYDSGEPPWSWRSCLRRHKEIIDNKIINYLIDYEDGIVDPNGILSRMKSTEICRSIIELMKVEYNNTREKLKEIGIDDYFMNVEMRLKTRLLANTHSGIGYDKGKMMRTLFEYEVEYYRAIQKLEVEYGYRVPVIINNIKFKDIEGYLNLTTKDSYSDSNFWEDVENHKCIEPFLEELYTVYIRKRDKTELYKVLSSISGRCKLSYEVIGTVTGRINVIAPGVQHMKKATRSIFIPNKGYRFIYADYCQFEPGILAHLSKDKKLIEMYNNGDIYTNLANCLGPNVSREIAKTILLSYLYGMSMSNIERRLKVLLDSDAEGKFATFIESFSSLHKWKKNCIENGLASGYFGNHNGYIRNITSRDTDHSVSRWGPNFLIQSYASMIFKSALVKITDAIPGIRLLVPMHDGILVECGEENFSYSKRRILTEMKKVLKVFCPSLKPKVISSRFSG